MTARPELHRPVAAARIGTAPVSFDVVADAAEREAIARRLGIVELRSLGCHFELRRGDDQARGEVSATGVLQASVVQDCVATLEAFEAPVGETFRIHFVHEGTETDELDPETDDEVPYGGESLDLGEAAVEQLALALDPYPRKPGAVVPQASAAGVISPFAALARRPRGG